MARPMTRLQLRTQVYARLAEQAGFFTDTEINQWLCDGIDHVSTRLEPLETSATIDTTATTTEYALPEDTISVRMAFTYILSSTEWQELEATTFDQLFRDDPDWQARTATLNPSKWYWRSNVIGLFPQPAASQDDGLKILYTYRPPEMADDTSYSGLPSYLDRCIILYAVYLAKFKDRNAAQVAIPLSDFEKELSLASGIMNKHRKENAPQLFPDQIPYRLYYHNRNPQRFKAWTVGS